MSDAPSSPVGAANAEENARVSILIVYALYLLELANGITAIAGVVLAYIKRGDARGTIYASHYANAISTFWIVLAASVVLTAIALEAIFGTVVFFARPEAAFAAWQPGALLLLPLVWLGFAALFVFYLYRTIKGFIRALDGRPY
jgi:uncharacterized membrane protein